MNWEAAGAIGEIIGAIAVFATLIYLAIQIRHTLKVANLDALERSTENWLKTQQPLLDREIAVLFDRGCSDYKSLDGPDLKRFNVLVASMLYEFENALEKQKSGLADPDLISAYDSVIDDLFQNSGVVQYWEEHSGGHLPVLQEWLDSRESQ